MKALYTLGGVGIGFLAWLLFKALLSTVLMPVLGLLLVVGGGYAGYRLAQRERLPL